ncbi:MAG: hypothetical protein A2W71_01945 [Candidatus Nealsonbacteria bacterium RIFCSPLOWO2_02_39_8]|uniref:Ribosomal RNA large subunit methyltransferase E n=1 Tax=Candidatus Nealsonbacteria bacterium RIFCSPLOWO2_02_39_8 TaxID=1801674 RepID=A0A1G2EJH8_9BACT|nr:MAG: hypothetical protein A2W71_01945 [Candidatus Nealsonbacteria bacterium RIFCSPLOWO2_02_39_8]
MFRKNLKNEFWTEKAKKEGYPARSVYKLKEIDEKFRLIKKGDKIFDLGCAPGSWLLYISERTGDEGVVFGIDFDDIKIELAKNIFFEKKDVMEEILKEKNFDLVVSDLAPKTTGIKNVDSGKSLELCVRAFEIAKIVLMPSGNFVCKIFEGSESDDFFKEIKKDFNFSTRFKPKAVLRQSKEIYIIAKDFNKG